jgi:hypothetical protein
MFPAKVNTHRGMSAGIFKFGDFELDLEEAFRTRAVRTVIIGDPFFSELVSDARYRDLLTSLRLPLPK